MNILKGIKNKKSKSPLQQEDSLDIANLPESDTPLFRPSPAQSERKQQVKEEKIQQSKPNKYLEGFRES